MAATLSSARILLAATLASSWAGCAPAPAVAPAEAAPAMLGYGLAPPSPVAYSVTDTATFSVHAGAMGPMTLTAGHAGTAHVEVSPAGDSLEATIRFLRFRGSLETEPEGVRRVDESDITGAFQVRLDRRGRIDIVETPALSPDLLDLTSAEALVRPLFVHLPGRPVDVGAQWVDTVTSVEESQETRTSARTIFTSTLVGDTLVDGASMLLLRTHAENRIELQGRSGGTEIRQILTGTTTGTVVWNQRLDLLVERHEEGHLTGSMDMPGGGVTGLPLTATVRRRVSLER